MGKKDEKVEAVLRLVKKQSPLTFKQVRLLISACVTFHKQKLRTFHE